MPGLDRTGPWGEGPRTGRQMGKCRPGNNPDDSINNLPERGFGPGRGRGYGNRFGRGYGRGSGRGPFRLRFGGGSPGRGFQDPGSK